MRNTRSDAHSICEGPIVRFNRSIIVNKDVWHDKIRVGHGHHRLRINLDGKTVVDVHLDYFRSVIIAVKNGENEVVSDVFTINIAPFMLLRINP